ncbi:MAG: hypothetical protein C0621_05815 [Desulfuromonas sp.]|nr:MAG: hypothetical protein C0621_05815 [Desulfuromonas sp.]
MKKLYSPQNEIELSIIRGLLDSEGIHYFVHNDHFGTMRTGPRIDLLNVKTILVDEIDEERASEIIRRFIKNNKTEENKEIKKYSFSDKLRMVAEMLIFGWFIPGNRWNRKNQKEKNTKE